AGPQWLRGRVSRAHRHVRDPPVVGCRGRARSDTRCHLPAVGLPTRVPRNARRSERRRARHDLARARRDAPARRADRVPRRLPQARARPNGPLGERPAHPHRAAHQLPAARRGGGALAMLLLAAATPTPIHVPRVEWVAILPELILIGAALVLLTASGLRRARLPRGMHAVATIVAA